ncbi:hypothetical protein VNO77_02335 [Canavalia gladiata]|uniref:Uncharacterized protein n=1 Tax=Canavalia gladiata TaxID=3824 RepID=A0AAN9RB66_CANGL
MYYQGIQGPLLQTCPPIQCDQSDSINEVVQILAWKSIQILGVKRSEDSLQPTPKGLFLHAQTAPLYEPRLAKSVNHFFLCMNKFGQLIWHSAISCPCLLPYASPFSSLVEGHGLPSPCRYRPFPGSGLASIKYDMHLTNSVGAPLLILAKIQPYAMGGSFSFMFLIITERCKGFLELLSVHVFYLFKYKEKEKGSSVLYPILLLFMAATHRPRPIFYYMIRVALYYVAVLSGDNDDGRYLNDNDGRCLDNGDSDKERCEAIALMMND